MPRKVTPISVAIFAAPPVVGGKIFDSFCGEKNSALLRKQCQRLFKFERNVDVKFGLFMKLRSDPHTLLKNARNCFVNAFPPPQNSGDFNGGFEPIT